MTEANETLDKLTRDDAINQLITPNGKKIKIFHVKNSALYSVGFTSGGELPSELDQKWTAPYLAEKAARAYVQKRWDENDKPSKGPGRPKKSDAEDATATQQ
jgi:hypothetical protein